MGNTNKAAIYSNGGNRWNILGINFTKRDALSSVYKISMIGAAVARLNESIAALNKRVYFPSPFCNENNKNKPLELGYKNSCIFNFALGKQEAM